MTVGWCSRATRAAVFAAVCVLLAALGHVTMSGSHVPAWALAAGAAVTGAVGWCLAGRERGLPLIVAVVVAAQAMLHSAFSLAQPAGAGPAFGSMASPDMGSLASMGDHMGSMDVGSMPMDSMDMRAMGMSPMAHLGHSSGGTSSLGMLAAHLLAALLCGLWLACGEKAAFRILRAVAGRLAAPLRLLLALPLTPDRPRTRVHRRRSHRAPCLLLLVHAITHRGPPVGTAVV
ncbi:hypothetical protein SY2F82_69070 [Streptomyces sp. Y2F8-2]|uniref:hypothetical protein n=1 Tax=unclassified Streptomyces TaxID=2593676 RepID=UPI00190748EB|nr:hypothetical protein [Streptomyces sp. Y2F8-2]GHK05110.1 hypothetical protein SY2F82_69070 [Streptomyces sp. Y2F8-2]